ncbi:hypothetical protein HPB52_008418 [Rhipicephalus sanguineus]|uniref:Uncharacterized protein n=1 Tax=Rhipicephalus sanguineus TaxID=34632 RepID=A0A9D4Q544_RHISA|nr:hypothetical protein HPB52_008418 [Rhipicephalus sanguineus]
MRQTWLPPTSTRRVRLATESRPPNIPEPSVSTARPNNAPLASKPQDAAISASTAASVSCIALAHATHVGSHVSVSIPRALLVREHEPPSSTLPPQSKTFGFTPKHLSLFMGSAALWREDSSGGYALESLMAKADYEGVVRIDYKAPVPHGLSHSLPELLYFPEQEGERIYYPSRCAVHLQDLPQKQQYAEPYYAPHMLRAK